MSLVHIVRPVLAGEIEAVEPGVKFSDQWKDLANILKGAVNVVFYVGIALCLIFMIIGGIKYATSGGDKEQAQAARGTITNSIIGFVVILGFRFILEIVLGLLGVQAPGWWPGY